MYEDIRDLMKVVKIRDVIESHAELHQVDDNIWRCHCPFHADEAESMFVDTSSESFYCLSCGIGGNAVTFLMRTGMLYHDVVKYLSKEYKTYPVYTQRKDKLAEDKSSFLAVNSAAADYYSNLLWEGNNEGMAYFRKRKLSDETIRNFKLGYAPNFGNGLAEALKEKGFKYEDAVAVGLCKFLPMLGNENEGLLECRDKMWNRVMFPVCNADGDVIAFGGRVLDDSKPKYINTCETEVYHKGNNLFAFNLARKSKRRGVILCEGYMDVIMLHQAGFDNAVASLGTALTEKQADLIKGLTKTVYISYDSDAPGIKAALRAIPILKKRGITPKIIHVEGAKDPDELIKLAGPEAFEECITNAKSCNEFFMEASRSMSDAKDISKMLTNKIIEEGDIL